MRVIDFIKRLEEIGYNEYTELTFGCVDENGEFYYLNLDTKNGDPFCYGEDFDGYPYDKQEINVGIDVEGNEEYMEVKRDDAYEILYRLEQILDEYSNKYSS